MLFQIFGFWSILCLILFVFAEIKVENKWCGILASVMLLVMGLVVMNPNEQLLIQTGQTTSIIETQHQSGMNNLTGFDNGTTDTSNTTLSQTNTTLNHTLSVGTLNNISRTENVTYVYSPMTVNGIGTQPLLGVIGFTQFLGLILVVISLGAFAKYIFTAAGYHPVKE